MIKGTAGDYLIVMGLVYADKGAADRFTELLSKRMANLAISSCYEGETERAITAGRVQELADIIDLLVHCRERFETTKEGEEYLRRLKTSNPEGPEALL